MNRSETTDTQLVKRTKNVFEKQFKYINNVPRIWKPIDAIELVYSQSRESAESALTYYSQITTQDISLNIELVSGKRQRDIIKRVGSDMEIAYIEAKRSVVNHFC